MRSGQTDSRSLHSLSHAPVDACGNLIGAVNMLVDITERKRAEEMGQRLAAIVESSDDAILSKDTQRHHHELEPGGRTALRLFGRRNDRQVGHDPHSG